MTSIYHPSKIHEKNSRNDDIVNIDNINIESTLIRRGVGYFKQNIVI